MQALKRVENTLDLLLHTVRDELRHASSESECQTDAEAPPPPPPPPPPHAEPVGNEELESARRRNVEVEQELAELKKLYANECNTLSALKEELARSAEHAASLDTQLEEARSDAEIERQRHARVAEELRTAERRVACVEEDVEETKKKLAHARQARTGKQSKSGGKKVSELEKDVEELQKLLRTERSLHEAEVERLRTDLAASRAFSSSLEEMCTEGSRLQLALQEMVSVQQVIRYVEELQAEKRTKGRVVRGDVETDVGEMANDAINELSVRMADVTLAVRPILERLGKQFAVSVCEQEDYEAITQSRALACSLQKDVLSPTGVIGKMKHDLGKFSDMCHAGRVGEAVSMSTSMVQALNKLTDVLTVQMGYTMGRFLQLKTDQTRCVDNVLAVSILSLMYYKSSPFNEVRRRLRIAYAELVTCSSGLENTAKTIQDCIFTMDGLHFELKKMLDDVSSTGSA